MYSNNPVGERFTHNKFKGLQDFNDNNASDECHMGFNTTAQKRDSSAQINRARVREKNVEKPINNKCIKHAHINRHKVKMYGGVKTYKSNEKEVVLLETMDRNDLELRFRPQDHQKSEKITLR